MKEKAILNLAKVPKELELLLATLSLEDNQSSIITEETLEGIDWEYFLKLTFHHRVFPIVYLNLKNIDKKWIPSRINDRLSGQYKKNTFQMLQLCGEMNLISQLFDQNNIRLLYLKGPVVAQEIYGDISLRTSRDLDILIQVKDIERAEQLLLNNGYQRNDPNSLNDWKRKHYHILYYNPQKDINIEIHWRLHPPPTKEPSFEELWERKRISNLTTYPVNFLSEEDLFIFLIIHGARHGWARLRWLIDIDKMVKRNNEFTEINRMFKKYRCAHLGGQAFILASTLLDTPLSEELQYLLKIEKAKQLAQNAISFMETTNEFKYPKTYTFLLKSNYQKIIYILHFFYPNYRDVEKIQIPRFLNFLHFPLRPILWFLRKIR